MKFLKAKIKLKYIYFILFFIFFYNLTVNIEGQTNLKKYEQHKQEGDEYVKKKDFMKAKQAYQTALQYNKNEAYVIERLTFCQAALKKQYNIFIKKADDYFKAGNLRNAKKNYYLSLKYLPKDGYALQQISACQGDVTGTFYKSYGGERYDEAKAIISSGDGGYIITGKTLAREMGSTDINLIKIDSYGKLVWTKDFGGKEADEAWDIIKTKDNNYLIVGCTESTGEDSTFVNTRHIWVIKVDKDGNKIWENSYGDVSSISEAHAATITEDNNCVIIGNTISMTGESFNHIVAIKIDVNGSQLWKKIYEVKDNQEAYDIVSTEDGFTILGNKEMGINNKWDIWLLHIDKKGNKIWDKNFGGQDNDVGNSLLYTKDKGYVIVGYTYSFAVASHDVWIIKANNKGEKEWEKVYGDDSIDEAFSIIQTKDKGFLAVGYTEVWEENEFGENSNPDGLNAYLIKLSKTGKQQWIRSIGGKLEQRLFDVVQADKGGYVVVGCTATKEKNMDVLVIKVNEEGMVSEPEWD